MPSRTDVPEYAEYLEKIEALVAVVNHRHGTPDWMPIDLKLRDDLEEAVASYKHYDVMMVNAMFDGMNLVAKEGPLVNERDGVSILSENTGAHEELGEFALSVNPFDVQELADAIYAALDDVPGGARAARRGLEGDRHLARSGRLDRRADRRHPGQGPRGSSLGLGLAPRRTGPTRAWSPALEAELALAAGSRRAGGAARAVLAAPGLTLLGVRRRSPAPSAARAAGSFAAGVSAVGARRGFTPPRRGRASRRAPGLGARLARPPALRLRPRSPRPPARPPTTAAAAAQPAPPAAWRRASARPVERPARPLPAAPARAARPRPGRHARRSRRAAPAAGPRSPSACGGAARHGSPRQRPCRFAPRC